MKQCKIREKPIQCGRYCSPQRIKEGVQIIKRWNQRILFEKTGMISACPCCGKVFLKKETTKNVFHASDRKKYG